ncbi:unnamed protein product [Caenorhabditis sp. 36 PRJEB53466]|nr:unnamed protein product [Caenorhabditis sp. 36 PRJEB53466]
MDLSSVKGFDQTTVLLNSQTNTLAKSVIYFLQKYDWTRIALVSPSTTLSAFDSRVRSDLLDALAANKIDILVDSRLDPMSDFSQKVEEDAQKARIFVICDWSSNANLLRNYLFRLGELNKMQSGEYFVVGFVAYDANYQWLEASSGDQRLLHLGAADINDYNLTENDLHAVYKNVVILSNGPPPAEANSTWAEVKTQVLEANTRKICPPYCNSTVSEKISPRWDRIKLLFDAIQYLADSVNDALNIGANIYDSSVFFEYLISRQIESITGVTEYVDGFGAIGGSMQVYYHFSSSAHNAYALFACARLQQISLLNENWTIFDYTEEGLSIDFVNGSAPKDTPTCGFYGEKCGPPANNTFIIVISVGVAVLIGLAIAAAFLYKRYRYERKLHSLFFLIERNQIILKKHTNLMSTQSLRSMASIHGSFVAASQTLRDSHFFIEDYNNMPASSSSQISSLFADGSASTARATGPFGTAFGGASEDEKWSALTDFGVGLFEGRTIALKRIYKTDVELSRDVRMEIAKLQESSNSNIISFVGMVVQSPNVFVVYELAQRGSLKDILDNDDMPLDDVFRNQMTKDIIAGLEYLHSSPVGCHGRLKSTNCLIDGRWMVRLSSFGLRELRCDENELERENDVQEGKSQLWTAPELLRWTQGSLAQCPVILVQKADVYSLAIVLYELFGRLGPWGDEPMEPREIVSIVKAGSFSREKKAFRPDLAVLKDSPQIVRDTVSAAWTEDPLDRPSLFQIKRKLRPLTTGLKRTIMDNMVSMIEKYTDKLERDIAERNEELEREKEKSEMLLKMMLPEVVAESLKKGSNVSAESFENVTVFFSDCPGFVEMSASSKPIDIVQFLNDLYTCFDRIIDQFDVYKVETIADAYMVASGIPVPNGNHHAGEIASLGLALLKAVETFKIRHLPTEKVRLRIGMNTGSCVAGVVGLKMPRYCLFGDTVNTASRMESNGIPLRINCSESSKIALDELGGYVTEERGLVEMKGKGKQMTYFVRSEDSASRRDRILRERVKFASLKRARVQEKVFEFV